MQRFSSWIVPSLQIAVWLLSINQRKSVPKLYLMQRPPDSSQRKRAGKRKSNSDRQTNGEGGQAAFTVAGVRQRDRQPGINRGKEVASHSAAHQRRYQQTWVNVAGQTDKQAEAGHRQLC